MKELYVDFVDTTLQCAQCPQAIAHFCLDFVRPGHLNLWPVNFKMVPLRYMDNMYRL